MSEETSEETNKTPVDIFERELRVGDLCVYPVRQGSAMWMNRLTIQRINFDASGTPSIRGQNQVGYPVIVKSLDRVAIIGRDNVVPFVE